MKARPLTPLDDEFNALCGRHGCPLGVDKIDWLIETTGYPRPAEDALRQMLAFAYCGMKLYADDGELQDNRALPYIDFKRDPVPVIQAKMTQRAQRALANNLPYWVASLGTGGRNA